MFEQVKPLLKPSAASMQVAGVISLYIWSIYFRSSYTSFLMGVFTTLATEAFLFWQFLTKKILKESGQKISIELASVEVKRIFGNDVGVNLHDIERKIKKKNYYQNNKSKPLLAFSDFKAKADAASLLNQAPQSSTNLAPQSINDMNMRPAFSHQPINELLQMKERTGEKLRKRKEDTSPSKINLEEKAKIIKVGHKSFNGHVTEYVKILDCISSAEKGFGKDMYSLNSKTENIFSSPDYLMLDSDEKEENSCEISSLSGEDLLFLKKKFGDHVQQRKELLLPEWKILKDTLSVVGKIHLNCSAFVSKVSVPTIDMMSLEYNEAYVEIKKERKAIMKEYEESYLAYFKLKNEYETLYKSLETALNDYQVKYKRKESDEVVLRYEMKARLLKSQLDSLRNKMVNATSNLKDSIKAVNTENDKLRQFISDWSFRQGSVCQNVLRSVISILEESAVDSERSFEVLFRNIEDLYCSMEDLDQSSDKGTEGERLNSSSIDEGNDAIMKLSERINVLSPSRPSVREPRSDRRMSRKITGADLESMFKSFKRIFADYNEVYVEETQKYAYELKKSKAILALVKEVSGFMDGYIHEKSKIISFSSLKMDIPNLNMYWSIVQENIRMITNLSTELREKLRNMERMYAENIRFFEREFKNSEIIINNAVKRATNFIKTMERELAVKSFGQLVRQWFNKSDSENQESGSPTVFDKIFGPENTIRLYNKEDDPIELEREYLKNDFKIGMTQIENAIGSFQKEATMLKKDFILSHLQSYCNQKELLFSLVKEIDKMNHFTENIENQLQDIYDQSDDEMENDEQLPEPRMEHRDSVFEPIKVNAQIDLERAAPNEQDSPSLRQEVYTKLSELGWINKMLKVLVLEWSKSSYFKLKIMKSMYNGFNKKKAKLIRQIKVKDFILGDQVPQVRSVTTLPSDSFEFLGDFELIYQGNMMMEIEVQFESQPILNMLNKDKPLFIAVKILIKSITGKIRICWVPTDMGTGWFSFVGTPLLDVKIEPKVGVSQYDLSTIPQLTTILKEVIDSRIRKMTYPYRKELELPMAFRPFKIAPIPDLPEDDDEERLRKSST